jgi:NAD(P) transhydrogenase subunit beta
MPQLVALFNGVGGGAAVLIAVIEFTSTGTSASTLAVIATVLTVLIGCVSFTGSIVTFLKLQELMTTAPVVLPAGRLITSAVAAASVVSAIALISSPSMSLLVVLCILSLALGVLFVLPVGGADVPIVISLLNAFTGLSVAASGYVLHNVLLIVAGTLVGASGTLLTQLMAEAMGRPITNTLFGAFKASTASAAGTGEERPFRSSSAQDVAIMLGYAQKVIIVPGYGLAVAQAQNTIRELVDLLTERGIEVEYAIHPVAGRMPGHMNVLLAESEIPYDDVLELDEINPEFSRADAVLVIGANDVVNPAARTNKSSPLYGMPILEAYKSKMVYVIKRSMSPGYSGVDNDLFYHDNCSLIFGDAKKVCEGIVNSLKSA